MIRRVFDVEIGERVGGDMTFKKWVNSIISGLACMADPTGALQRPVMSQSDEEAIRSDWQAVGNDLRKALQEIGKNDNQM